MKEESNMKYFSEAYFRNIAYSTPLYEQRTYSDNLQGASLYKQFDIFLSYNISDLKIQQTQGRKNHSSEILFKFISEQCGANNFIYNPLVNNICRQT